MASVRRQSSPMTQYRLSRRHFLRACCCCALAGATSALAVDAEVPALSMEALAAGVWRHTTWNRLDDGRLFPSNGLLVLGSTGALLIDTSWRTSEMAPLLAQSRELAGDRPLRLAVTHAHGDRMSGIEIARQQGVLSYAYVLSQEDAPRRGLPMADRTWKGDRTRFDLGSTAVEMFYPGPAHTRDNVVAFVEHAGVLFGGCMLRTSGIGNTEDADLGQWASSTDRVIGKYGSRTLIAVPGHGDPGGPELLERTRAIAVHAAGEGR